MAKQEKPIAVSVGFFILTGTILFVAGIFWLKVISAKPAYTFDVAYVSPEHLESGALVYYRGVEVGRVMSVRLSDDDQETLVKVGIASKTLKLPKDVRIKIRLEGITGQRNVEIDPPEDNAGDMAANTSQIAYLHDGDVIMGAENMTWERIQKQLNELVEKHTLEKTINDTQKAMAHLEMASARVDQFVATAQPDVLSSIHSIRSASRKIDTAVDGVSTGVQQFNEKTKNLDKTIATINDAASQTGQTMSTINAQLQDTNVIHKVAQTSDEVKTGMTFINHSLGATPQGTGNSSPVLADKTDGQTTVRSFGCVAGRMNYILKQRFLLFRLMFGKPGAQYVCPADATTARKTANAS